ncbi:pilus protein, partial [Escherichia coli]
GGATVPVAASQGFASGMEARQGGDSFAGSVHDSPPRQGDARKSHKQERNGKKVSASFKPSFASLSCFRY